MLHAFEQFALADLFELADFLADGRILDLEMKLSFVFFSARCSLGTRESGGRCRRSFSKRGDVLEARRRLSCLGEKKQVYDT